MYHTNAPFPPRLLPTSAGEDAQHGNEQRNQQHQHLRYLHPRTNVPASSRPMEAQGEVRYSGNRERAWVGRQVEYVLIDQRVEEEKSNGSRTDEHLSGEEQTDADIVGACFNQVWRVGAINTSICRFIPSRLPYPFVRLLFFGTILQLPACPTLGLKPGRACVLTAFLIACLSWGVLSLTFVAVNAVQTPKAAVIFI
jgi:hypothetical protein